MQIIDMRPKNKEVLTPREFIDLNEAERSAIKTTRIIPPKLGQGVLGAIEVTYKTPRYCAHE